MTEAPSGRSDGRARSRQRVLVVAAALVVVVAGAWLLERAVNGSAGGPSGPPAPPAYSVRVTRDGAELKTFTVDDLRGLPQASEEVDGKLQEGPSLPAVLVAAGVGTSYESLVITGLGVRDDGRLRLPAARVNEAVLLDFSDRGTMKVVSPALDWSERVRDVVEIAVD